MLRKTTFFIDPESREEKLFAHGFSCPAIHHLKGAGPGVKQMTFF
jgi:hypothetical protein